MKYAAILFAAGLTLAGCASTNLEEGQVAVTSTSEITDEDNVVVETAAGQMTLAEAKTEECRRVKDSGSNLRRKVCLNKATWAEKDKMEKEASEALRDRVAGSASGGASSSGGVSN